MEFLCKVVALVFLFCLVVICSHKIEDDRGISSIPYHLMGISIFLLIVLIINLIISLE